MYLILHNFFATAKCKKDNLYSLLCSGLVKFNNAKSMHPAMSGEKHSLNSRWKSSLRTTLNLDSCYLVLQVNFCLIWLNLADLAFDQGNVVHVHLRSKQMTINMGSSWCFINVFNRRAKVKFFIRKSFLLMVKPSRQNCTHSWSIWSNP